MDDLTGKTLGPYQVLLKIRASQTTTVYRAFHTTLGRYVTLQAVLHGHPRPPELAAKLQEYSKILGRLKHPNIGQLLDCIELDGELCMIYDFAPRAVLRRRFRQQVEWQQALRMLVPAAQALSHAHSQGIIHGAFRSASVLYNMDGAPLIFDMGVELLIAQELIRSTPGNWLGSDISCYRSPEQVAGKPFDQRADIYAFGMTLYDLVTGRRAFQCETTIEEIVAQATRKLTLTEQQVKKLPAIAEDILRKTLAADPDQRFKDMQHVSTLLAKMVLGQPVHRKMLTNPLWAPRKPIALRTWLSVLIFLVVFIGLGAYLSVRLPAALAARAALVTETATVQSTMVAALKATAQPTVAPTRKPTLIPATPTAAAPVRSDYPYLFDRPVPIPSTEISLDSVSRLVTLSRFGIGWLYDIDWSPDGTQVALATSTGVYVLNAQTHAFETYLNTASSVMSLSFSPDSSKLATGDEDGLVRLWQVNTALETNSFSGHSLPVRRVVFSPDGKNIATVSDSLTGWMWAVDGQTPGVALTGHVQALTSVAFSPDSTQLVTAARDFNLKQWSVPSGELIATLVGRSPILDVAYTQDGANLITGDGGAAIHLWSLAEGKIIEQLGRMSLPATEIEPAPDGSSVAAADTNGNVTVFDMQGNKRWSARNAGLPRQNAAALYINRIVFSPDGTTLASAIWDNTVLFWDSASGTETASIRRFGDFITQLQISPNSQLLAGQTLDGRVKVWDFRTGSLSFTAPGSLVAGRPFSSDNKLLAVREDAATVVAYNAATGNERFRFGGHNDIRSISFSPGDTNFLAAGNSGAFSVWSLVSQQEFDTHTNFGLDGCSISLTRNESQLAFVTRFHYIDFMNSATKSACKMTLVGWMQSHTFQQDGPMAAAGGASKLEVWNYMDGSKGVDMKDLYGFQVQQVALAPSGNLVAGALDDGTIRLWNTATGSEVMRVMGHDGGVRSMVFSPDGHYLITSALDSTILIWGIP